MPGPLVEPAAVDGVKILRFARGRTLFFFNHVVLRPFSVSKVTTLAEERRSLKHAGYDRARLWSRSARRQGRLLLSPEPRSG